MTRADDIDPVRELERIMQRLRAPDGCPWDREQTWASMRPYLLEECHEVLEAIDADDFHPERFEAYATTLREGIENMRKLVYAFYNPNFSFRDLTNKHPNLAGDITDCLSGDVNKDFSRLWAAVKEFAPIPSKLPIGMPKASEVASA